MRAPKKLDGDRLWAYALRCLGGRAHSSGELREKLRRRAEQAGDVDAVVKKLKESGYLNDQQFAESFASARLESGGAGSSRVLRDLRQRRVASAMAEKVVERTFRDTDETALIEQFLERKYRNRNLVEYLAEEKNLAQVFRRLRYAGFSARNAIDVLKRHARNEEVLDALASDDSEPAEHG